MLGTRDSPGTDDGPICHSIEDSDVVEIGFLTEPFDEPVDLLPQSRMKGNVPEGRTRATATDIPGISTHT